MRIKEKPIKCAGQRLANTKGQIPQMITQGSVDRSLEACGLVEAGLASSFVHIFFPHLNLPMQSSETVIKGNRRLSLGMAKCSQYSCSSGNTVQGSLNMLHEVMCSERLSLLGHTKTAMRRLGGVIYLPS